MKATELRIGNYVKWKTEDVTTFEIINYITSQTIGLESDIDFDTLTPIELFKPIPLTEEWLLKFGFERQLKMKWAGDGWIHPNSILFDLYKKNKYMGYYQAGRHTKDFFYAVSIEIMFVHQLQNLYFALTGEELEIKE